MITKSSPGGACVLYEQQQQQQHAPTAHPAPPHFSSLGLPESHDAALQDQLNHKRTAIAMAGASSPRRDEEVSQEGNVCNFRGRWGHYITAGVPVASPQAAARRTRARHMLVLRMPAYVSHYGTNMCSPEPAQTGKGGAIVADHARSYEHVKSARHDRT